MRKLLLTTTALLGLNAGAAYAYMDADAIVAYFANEVPRKIEIERGLRMTKVEVTTADGRKIEVIFDNGDENTELFREEKDANGKTIFESGVSSLEDAFDDDNEDDGEDENDDDDDHDEGEDDDDHDDEEENDDDDEDDDDDDHDDDHDSHDDGDDEEDDD